MQTSSHIWNFVEGECKHCECSCIVPRFFQHVDKGFGPLACILYRMPKEDFSLWYMKDYACKRYGKCSTSSRIMFFSAASSSFAERSSVMADAFLSKSDLLRSFPGSKRHRSTPGIGFSQNSERRHTCHFILSTFHHHTITWVLTMAMKSIWIPLQMILHC